MRTSFLLVVACASADVAAAQNSNWDTSTETVVMTKCPGMAAGGGDKLPQSLITFYDVILSNPCNYVSGMSPGNATHWTDATLADVFHDDWQTRPNPLQNLPGAAGGGDGNPTGPGPAGIKTIMGLWCVMMPNIQISRVSNFVFGNGVNVVLSDFGATMAGLPTGVPEYPFFPGRTASTLTGQAFRSMAMDVQIVVDGKMKQTWHMEDWLAAGDQMINSAAAFTQANPKLIGMTEGAPLAQVPKSVKMFYDEILSDPCGGGQNMTKVNMAVNSDWNTRSNPLEPFPVANGGGLPGPMAAGLSTIMGFWCLQIPEIQIKRKYNFLFDDTVIALSSFTATMRGCPSVGGSYAYFPGIPCTEFVNKTFVSWALDIQTVEQGKIKQTWHFEDWQAAAELMLDPNKNIDMGFGSDYVAVMESLTCPAAVVEDYKCGDIKSSYKSSGCCGTPTKMMTVSKPKAPH